MAQGSGIRDITSAAGLNESVSGDEVVLVYFGFGAKSAENPHSLGDEFDPQFEEFAESGEVVPKLFRAVFSDVTAQFFADIGIDAMLGGSLVLWKQGAVLAKASVKELSESSDVETEVVRWLAGKYPSQAESAKARPARPSSAVPARAQVAGPTPGTACGAPPPGPPPPPSGNPSVATNTVFGAALSGPPPGPKSAVPGQTPGAMCGAPPVGPPPAGPRTPGQPTTMTVGAALSGPPPGPKATVPGQTPGTMCGAPPAGPPPGPRTPGQPTTMTIGAALSGPPPGPKATVPGQTPGTMCGAPPVGPPPSGPRTPGQPTTMTVGAALSGPPPGPKATVPGQTPGTMCGAPPAGPPPARPTTPGQPTTMTVGAALSGPPPGPKAPLPPSEPPETASPPPPPPPAPPQEDSPPPPPTPQLAANEPVPIKHPETPCPVPPPVLKADGDRTPSQPARTPPSDLKASISPTPVAKQAPVTPGVQSPVVCEEKDADIAKGKPLQKQVEKAPLPPVDLGSGPQACEAAPEPPSGLDMAVADSLPTDDAGERIAKLFASHGKHGTVNRDTMKALLQFLLTKQGSRKGLVPAQLDRIVDTFIEESDSGSCINASQFIQWVWSGAKSRK